MRQSERSLGASAASALGLLRTSNIAAISCHRWQPAGHLKQRRWRNRDRLCEERHSDACRKLGRPERPVAQVSSRPPAPTSQAPHRHVRTSAGGSGARPNPPQPADWQGSLREGRARPGSHAGRRLAPPGGSGHASGRRRARISPAPQVRRPSSRATFVDRVALGAAQHCSRRGTTLRSPGGATLCESSDLVPSPARRAPYRVFGCRSARSGASHTKEAIEWPPSVLSPRPRARRIPE